MKKTDVSLYAEVGVASTKPGSLSSPCGFDVVTGEFSQSDTMPQPLYVQVIKKHGILNNDPKQRKRTHHGKGTHAPYGSFCTLNLNVQT